MNTKSVLLGVLIGGITSAATALILAPKSGREIRQDIASKSGEASVILKELAIMQQTCSNPFKF